MLKVLDLFSGIGGFSLGLERTGGFETVAFCEIEDYPRRVLAKHWPNVPIYEDVKELTYERLETDGLGGIDIIVGGYPCQPFSTAGKRRGAEDDRHLWPEVKRLMATVRPTWGVFENVAGHISMGLDEVLSDLAERRLHRVADHYSSLRRRCPAQTRQGLDFGPHQTRGVFATRAACRWWQS
jgi:DNA (cytosine-5)-methyltransferase 1